MEDLATNTEEREAYYNFKTSLEESAAGCIHRIGGYPDFVQDDPKLESHLVSHGLYCWLRGTCGLDELMRFRVSAQSAP